MDSLRETFSDRGPGIVLEGGPTDIPTEMRMRHTPPGDQKIKLLHRGGYEHFERSEDELGDMAPIIFRWTMRTEIAE